VLHPRLVDLGPDERRALPKSGPKTTDFVDRTMGYGRAMPQYVPAFVDIEEFQRFLDTTETLLELQHTVRLTNDMLDDSLMLARSLAMESALSIWDSMKSAAKRGLPDAQAAAADLAARYPRGKKGKAARKGPAAGGQDGANTAKGA
jgi:hypothetical protein